MHSNSENVRLRTRIIIEQFDILQNGFAGKNIDLTVAGNTNKFTINQKSTLNVDSIKINTVGNGSTVLINQCNAGGC